MATIPFLGDWLNKVTSPVFECPACHRLEPMDVYRYGVRWACGHEQQLPPMPTGRGGRPFHRKEQAA